VSELSYGYVVITLAIAIAIAIVIQIGIWINDFLGGKDRSSSSGALDKYGEGMQESQKSKLGDAWDKIPERKK
jgi:hypothetical protein